MVSPADNTCFQNAVGRHTFYLLIIPGTCDVARHRCSTIELPAIQDSDNSMRREQKQRCLVAAIRSERLHGPLFDVGLTAKLPLHRLEVPCSPVHASRLRSPWRVSQPRPNTCRGHRRDTSCPGRCSRSRILIGSLGTDPRFEIRHRLLACRSLISYRILPRQSFSLSMSGWTYGP